MSKKYPAKYVVFWPGQETKACDNHFHQMKRVNAAMGGMPLPWRNLADTGESGECANCVNEAKRKTK